MISPPRRSVTRFFIPLIDVLILLFGIFLLMPFVSTPTEDPGEKTEGTKNAPPPLPTDVKELQRQLVEAQRRLERFQRERAQLADRLSIRVLQIDPENGDLYYYDPERQKVDSAEAARRLIDRQRRIAGAKDPYFLILYPRASGFPLESQVTQYNRWFHDVPFGYDKPELAQ